MVPETRRLRGESIGAELKDCSLVPGRSLSMIETWDRSAAYDVRIQSFVKNGWGSLDGTNYSFILKARLD